MFSYPPTLSEYTSFLYGALVGIDQTLLPDTSPAIAMSFQVATDTVNDDIAIGSQTLYTIAVYNLGADRLVNFAVDVAGQTYFHDLREKLRLWDPKVGIPSSANDGGTAVGILNPDQLKTLTLDDLQMLKTPWGRRYMGIAQKYGQDIWGLT